MDKQSIYRPSVSHPRKEAGPEVIAFGLWVRMAIVGAGAVVTGVVLASASPASALLPLALVIGGSLSAAVGWRRARRILNAADEQGVVSDAPLPGRPGPMRERRIEPRAT